MNLNQATLIGRVTRDPELRTLPNGTPVVKFSIATNNTYKNKEGQKVEETDFHNVSAFGRLAETIGQYVKKGQELLVIGRIKNRTWEKQDGTKGYATEIMMDTFSFGAKPKGSEERSAAEAISHGAGEADEIRIEDIPF